MDSTPITEVPDHRHLGITFSNDRSWNIHIVKITTTAWQPINILRAFKFKLDKKSLESMYISFIRPILEYSGAIWDNCSNEDSKLLEAVQIEAMRIIIGATKLCSISKLYEDTRFITLSKRHELQKLTIFYKMMNGLAPEYLNCLVPPFVQDASRYSLGNSNNLNIVPSNSNLYYNSFVPSTKRLWNNLPLLVRNSTSLNEFKKNISGQCIKPPEYSYFGDRPAQIYHARLRLECSSLRSHLYHKNLVENSLCSCGEVETTKQLN